MEQAEEELRHAVAARDEFFSIATHELKDPLFALELSLQLLRRSAQKLGLQVAASFESAEAVLTGHARVAAAAPRREEQGGQEGRS